MTPPELADAFSRNVPSSRPAAGRREVPPAPSSSQYEEGSRRSLPPHPVCVLHSAYYLRGRSVLNRR